jgi:hypothetical protein
MPIRDWLVLVAIVVAVTGRAGFPGCPAHFKAQDINVTGGQPADTSCGIRHSLISPVTGATEERSRCYWPSDEIRSVKTKNGPGELAWNGPRIGKRTTAFMGHYPAGFYLEVPKSARPE